MVELALPKNSQVKSGKHWPAPAGAKKVKTFKIDLSARLRRHDQELR